MSKKHKGQKQFDVPAMIELRGTVTVDADSAEEARKIVENGHGFDDNFHATAERWNWDVTGEPKLVRDDD